MNSNITTLPPITTTAHPQNPSIFSRPQTPIPPSPLLAILATAVSGSETPQSLASSIRNTPIPYESGAPSPLSDSFRAATPTSPIPGSRPQTPFGTRLAPLGGNISSSGLSMLAIQQVQLSQKPISTSNLTHCKVSEPIEPILSIKDKYSTQVLQLFGPEKAASKKAIQLFFDRLEGEIVSLVDLINEGTNPLDVKKSLHQALEKLIEIKNLFNDVKETPICKQFLSKINNKKTNLITTTIFKIFSLSQSEDIENLIKPLVRNLNKIVHLVNCSRNLEEKKEHINTYLNQIDLIKKLFADIGMNAGNQEYVRKFQDMKKQAIVEICKETAEYRNRNEAIKTFNEQNPQNRPVRLLPSDLIIEATHLGENLMEDAVLYFQLQEYLSNYRLDINCATENPRDFDPYNQAIIQTKFKSLSENQKNHLLEKATDLSFKRSLKKYFDGERLLTKNIKNIEELRAFFEQCAAALLEPTP